MNNIINRSKVIVMALIIALIGGIFSTSYGTTDTIESDNEKPVYTCYFDANGGSINQSSKTIQHDTIYGSLPNPTKSKYVFRGWYTAKKGGTEVTQYSEFTGTTDINLYAKWQKKTSYEKEVMKHINKERKKRNLNPLKWDAKLKKGTNKRAKEITKKFSHRRPNGGSGSKYLLKFVKKGRSIGECLGKGFNDPKKLVDAFMNSPSHERVLMGRSAKTCAITSKTKGGVTYWCVGTSALYKCK